MSLSVPTMGGGGSFHASILVTGLSETDTVTASNGRKTRNGVWFKRLNPAYRGLPDGYTQLSYIESTAQQGFDTGFVPTQNDLRVKTTFIPNAQTVQYPTIWQVYDGKGSPYLGRAFSQFSGGHITSVFGEREAQAPYSVGTEYETECYYADNTAYLKVNGSVYTGTTNGCDLTQNTNSISLFGEKGFAANVLCSIKSKGYVIEHGGAVVRDYVPCKRDSDGTIGFYDTVNDTFGGSATSTAFIAGEEVPQYFEGHEITKIRDVGMWTVTATNGVKTATQDVFVDAAVEYEIDMKYRTYLYRYGDECEALTGGWDCQPGLGNSSVTKTADSIYTNGYGDNSGSVAVTKKKINLTEFKTIHAEISDFEYGHCAAVVQVLYDTVSLSNTGTFTGCGWKQGANATGVLNGDEINVGDISAVTGEHVIGFVATTGGAYSDSYISGHLYAIWLE